MIILCYELVQWVTTYLFVGICAAYSHVQKSFAPAPMLMKSACLGWGRGAYKYNVHDMSYLQNV